MNLRAVIARVLATCVKLSALVAGAACLAGCTPNLTRQGVPCPREMPEEFHPEWLGRLVVVAPGVTINSPSDATPDHPADPGLERITLSCGKKWCAGQAEHEISIKHSNGIVDKFYVPSVEYYGGVSRRPPFICRMVSINRGGDMTVTWSDFWDQVFFDN